MKVKLKEQISRRSKSDEPGELEQIEEDSGSAGIDVKQPSQKQQTWIDKIKKRFKL